MTPEEVWAFAQLARRLHPHGHDEADLLVRAIAWLEDQARKGQRQ